MNRGRRQAPPRRRAAGRWVTRNGAQPSTPVIDRIRGPRAKPADTTMPKIAMMRPRCVSDAEWFTHASPAIHRKLAAIPSAKRSGNHSHTLGKGAKQGEQRHRREYRGQHQQGGAAGPQQPRGERGDREDRDEVGAGVEPDEGFVDALVVEHQREQGHGQPVREARDRERDGGDDELSPARGRRGGGGRCWHSGGRERGEGADYLPVAPGRDDPRSFGRGRGRGVATRSRSGRRGPAGGSGGSRTRSRRSGRPRP